jgi:IS5 family transposase
MDAVAPWDRLCVLVSPHYPNGEGGRPPISLERMLRIYFLQQWFNLSDPGVEEALYDSVSMRAFARIDRGRERAPDETTVCKCRHLLERHGLGAKILHEINAHLAQAGAKVSHAKNSEGKCDPEMHQTMKGNEWHFGMVCHEGNFP